MITLTLTLFDVKTTQNLATIQERLEEVVRLIPHKYEVFQNSGESIEVNNQAISSDAITVLSAPRQ